MKKKIGGVDFKGFLLNEDKAYLGQRIGYVLDALHDLSDNMQAMGTRQQVKNAEAVVHQIRRILHSGWREEEEKYLKKLQKAAVAIMRAIEEKDDLPSIVQGATAEIEKVQGDLGTPIHSLGTPEQEEEAPSESPDSGVSEPQGKEDQQNQQQPAPPPGAAPGEMPPPGGQPGTQPPQAPPPPGPIPQGGMPPM